jgi:hypothetical protein
MRRRPRYVHHQHLQRAGGQPETFGFPRRHVFLLATLTGMAGFLASGLLLRGGMWVMWSRYLAAFGVAYLAFLGLFWRWLSARTEDWRDFPDFSNSPSRLSPPPTPAHNIVIHHGDFDGGGACVSLDSGSLDSVRETPAKAVAPARLVVERTKDRRLPPLLTAFFTALFVSSLYLVWLAPTLFADLLVDSALSAGLYHRLRKLQTRRLITTAIRNTAWPFALTALAVAGIAWSMALYAPGAHSFGDVLAYANGQR